jgi:4-alpha-glucanotransferase
MRLAWGSVAHWALAPLQDVLSLDTAARMNFPGRPSGNWCWRFTTDMLTRPILDRLADMTDVYARYPKSQAPTPG